VGFAQVVPQPLPTIKILPEFTLEIKGKYLSISNFAGP
jgi:hypothetical protein